MCEKIEEIVKEKSVGCENGCHSECNSACCACSCHIFKDEQSELADKNMAILLDAIRQARYLLSNERIVSAKECRDCVVQIDQALSTLNTTEVKNNG